MSLTGAPSFRLSAPLTFEKWSNVKKTRSWGRGDWFSETFKPRTEGTSAEARLGLGGVGGYGRGIERPGPRSPIICGIPPRARPAKPVRSVEGVLGNPVSPTRGCPAIGPTSANALSGIGGADAGTAGCGAGGSGRSVG